MSNSRILHSAMEPVVSCTCKLTGTGCGGANMNCILKRVSSPEFNSAVVDQQFGQLSITVQNLHFFSGGHPEPNDNAPCQKAKKIQKFFDFEDVNRLPWPACSPDMNPFDTLWAKLSTRLVNREVQPKTWMSCANVCRKSGMQENNYNTAAMETHVLLTNPSVHHE
ncbi:hypothetical protein CAPTEDRAFT_200023 [Capitella teleta]|uniref:Tc1-like transposase DDE domain-containing protein n=1 Tax=Capitella teleta TaxID=283909 RepID=R7VC23_CAPTE|nr:hypothetical protein CAPTEDRAFT_200023 [Capitella teleta]|eukprot:ELU13866.1 hypothetical protein CAPTEDRAFT_200023 [Capitella teleta]